MSDSGGSEGEDGKATGQSLEIHEGKALKPLAGKHEAPMGAHGLNHPCSGKLAQHADVLAAGGQLLEVTSLRPVAYDPKREVAGPVVKQLPDPLFLT